MFGNKKKKADDANSGVMQKSARGNMDEYQALRTIIAENQGLLVRVLEKIRIQRTLSGKTPKPPELKKDEKDSPQDKKAKK